MKTLFFVFLGAWLFYTYGAQIDRAYDELQADRLIVKAYFEKIGLQ